MIGDLPNEILSEIFKARYQGSDKDNERPGLCPGDVVLLRITHVCRRWRFIAISTPTFWSRLVFKNGAPFELHKVWLERSKDAPLDITIAATPLLSMITMPDAILHLLVPHKNRWHRLSYMRLRTTDRLTHRYRYSTQTNVLLGLLLLEAPPQLKSLEMDCFTIPQRNDSENPWRRVNGNRILGGCSYHLTSLKITFTEISPHILYCLLKAACNVIKLELRGTYHGSSFQLEAPDGYITVKHLQSLRIGYSGPLICLVLSWLDAPQLLNLTIDDASDVELLEVNAFFASKINFSAIRELEIIRWLVHAPEIYVRNFFARLTSLEVLKIRESALESTTFFAAISSRIDIQGSTSALLPKLRAVHLPSLVLQHALTLDCELLSLREATYGPLELVVLP